MEALLPFVLLGLFLYGLMRVAKREQWKKPTAEFPKEWRKILIEKVPFYYNLDQAKRKQFEVRIQEFLLNTDIIGVRTKVEDIDRVYITASAVIPIFAFPEWKYFNLREVLLYPSRFNHHFQSDGEGANILGMVGDGVMDGKMILSKKALRRGFDIDNDKKNTAIHEFIHLIDKADGQIDGIPEVLMDKPYVLPWMQLVTNKMARMKKGKTDINPYGATNQAEFLSVLGEYFFEHPELLKKRHPEVYKYLKKIFKQDMIAALSKKRGPRTIGRNDPCLCGSGEKYKHCCGKVA